jgi:SNF2 family DNA or RNA helicase
MTATATTIEEKIHEALQFLAGHCDFAKEKDGIGFNAIDAQFGHSLAIQPVLSAAQVLIAAKMVRKYRRQLEGILELPEMPDVEHYAQVAQMKSKEITAPAKKTRKDEEESKVTIDGKYVVVTFPYDADKVAAMQPLRRSIKKWDFNKRYDHAWSFPASALEQVMTALSPFSDFIYPPEIEAYRELQRQTAELEAKLKAEEVKVALSRVQPYLDGAALPGGRVLFAHQREAVRQLIEGQRMILAHDMGLGKTLDALVAAKAYDCSVIVVCPASLKIN